MIQPLQRVDEAPAQVLNLLEQCGRDLDAHIPITQDLRTEWKVMRQLVLSDRALGAGDGGHGERLVRVAPSIFDRVLIMAYPLGHRDDYLR